MSKTDDSTAAELRRAFSDFPTGVVLLAAQVSGHPVGLLATSFTSVSLDPPLVQVAMANTSTSWPALDSAEHLGISVLTEHHIELAGLLSRPPTERFDGIPLEGVGCGALALEGASAVFTVKRHSIFDAGDHSIVVLRIVGFCRARAEAPVVFHHSRFRRLAP